MRKHSVRKWIHAILDLLPLLVIPIFAINIINRSVELLSVEYGDIYTEVNYKYETNEVNSLQDIQVGRIYHFNGAVDLGDFDYSAYQITISLLSGYVEFSEPSISFYSNINNNEPFSFITYGDVTEWYFVLSNYVTSEILQEFYFDDVDLVFYTNGDLTDWLNENNIFGLQSFSASDFNVIESVEEVHDTVIYNDTDIGSQFMYSLYHVTDKYFNMNDTFNLGQVYEWFTTNIFGGNPPLAVPIVWNVIIYEFIMDLLFLLYAVFMFVIDFAESFMERMFDKARCGGK